MPNPKLETYKNKATGTVYDFTDADAQSKISATVDLMKDTTGWIGGNELKNVSTSQTLSNVDVTVSDNKTVNLNGTASANITSLFINTHVNLKAGKYYLSGNPEGITGNEYGLRISDASYSINTFFEQGKVFELAQDMTDLRVDIRVPSGTVCNNTLFKPMILTEEQYKLNPAYRPHHVSVEEEIQNIYDFNAKTGVHQLIPTKLSYLKTRNTAGTWTGNSYTINGITYDISVDDNDNVTKIAVSGNSTAYSEFLFTDRTRKDLKLSSASNYIISLGHDSVRVTVGTGNSGDGSTGTYVVVGQSADNNEVEFTGIDKYVSISIDIPSDTNISDSVDIYPLFRYAEDINNGYGVFAMTNRELTESLKYRNVQLTPVPNTGTNYEKVVNVAEQLDALITDVGVKFSGYVLWTQSMFLRVEAMRCNATTLLYTIFNVSNTIYNGAVQNGAVTVYKFEGTQMTS